ncbi:hypothetical protein [Tenacibaculum jejuense]|uniref:Uncharacterized protein n=1 Tax=Tenacibaculum jejuense TaxID=584609 RepID=A0A238UEE3_9FLAO|nr:hypothetical protein [Tenacibaculum jejuense]SNR16780.1 protein of unknown function [Tenacibaculum jejuense]
MGVFEKIEGFFLGNELTFTDSYFGEITSERIKKGKKKYNWYVDDYLIPNKENETTSIILQGDSKTPDKEHIEILKQILNNLDFLFDRLNQALKDQNEGKEKKVVQNWLEEYYFMGINSLHNEKGFSFYLEPFSEENSYPKDVSFDYVDGEIKDLDFQ